MQLSNDGNLFGTPTTSGLSTPTITVADTLGATTSITLQLDILAPGNQTLFADNFEAANGWITDPNGTDTATTGQWQIGNPDQTISSGTTLQPGTTIDGQQALVTGPAGGSSVGTWDIDNGETSVISPSIQLPANSQPILDLHWYFGLLNNATEADYFKIDVIGSSSSLSILNQVGNGTTRSAAYAPLTADLSPLAGETIVIRLAAADGGSGSLVEAGIDALSITTPDAPETPAPVLNNIANQQTVAEDPTSLVLTGAHITTYNVIGLPPGLVHTGATIAGTPTQPGVYIVQVAGYNGNGHSASTSFTWTIEPATTLPVDPVLAWSTPTAITYSSPLGASQLNATANVPGSFSYTPTAGTVLNAGTHALQTTFTPDDLGAYNIVNASVTVEVNPAPLTVTANDVSRNEGQANPSFTGSIEGAVNGDVLAPSYSTTATPASPPGTSHRARVG